MPDGFHLRYLPDGCLEFVLGDPVLRGLVVAEHVALRLGPVDVVLFAPFDLIRDGTGHVVDTGDPPTLAPVVTLVRGVVRWLVATHDGGLTVEFVAGERLVVPGPVVARTWAVGAASGGR